MRIRKTILPVLGFVCVAVLVGAAGPNGFRQPPQNMQRGLRGLLSRNPKWFPPLQARMVTTITQPGQRPATAETTITVGRSRLLIEPLKKGKPGLLLPSDPFRERPGIVLDHPQVILRWAGDIFPIRFPLRAALDKGGRREPSLPERLRMRPEGLKWEDDQIQGRQARKIAFETRTHKVTLWRDTETGMLLKIVREARQGGVKEEIVISDLERLLPDDADKYIADFLSRYEEWQAEDWESEDRVRSILHSEGVPVSVGNLPARRVKFYHRGNQRFLRVFYGGREMKQFFAAELTKGNVPSFGPETPHLPIFSGTVDNWKVRIWTSLPRDMARRQIRIFRDRLVQLHHP